MGKINVVGFRIEAFSDKGIVAVKKNSKIPLMMRPIISSKVISEVPFIIEIKLRPKLFKKNRDDSTKKLVISSAEKLREAITMEMVRADCEQDLDFNLEVLRE